MVLSRRSLCAAALGAAFALSLAGTAPAATYTWVGLDGTNSTKWDASANWQSTDGGSTYPQTGDTAIIGAGAAVEVDTAAAAQVVDLGEGAKLTLSAVLTIGDELRASGNATVTSKVERGLTFGTNNVAVSADKTLTLAANGGTIVGVVGAPLQLSGGGTLVLAAPVTSVTHMTVTDGTLTLAQGVKIGDDTAPDGEVDLKDKGHLVLNGNLTLRDLKTAGGSKITANGNVLTIIDPTSPFVLDAGIDKGTLSLDVAAGQTATLSKDVANVVFNGKNGGAPTLKIEAGVFVNHLDIRGSATEPASLDFAGEQEHTIGTLKFVRTTPLVVSYGKKYVKVEKLILADGAALALKLMGGTALTIQDGTPGKNWNVTMGNTDTDFRVGNAGLLSGNVEVTLGGGTLYLPHGAYPNLTLKAEFTPTSDPTIEADVFEGDPVLTVGKVELSSNMRMKADGIAWKRTLEAGKTLTLLKVNTAVLNGNVIKGDPEQDKTPADYWKVARLEGTKTELVLTALKTITVPDLVAEASYSGNKCTVNVKVSGDVKVNESNWNADMILGDRPENDPAYKNPRTGSEKGAVFEVILPSGFTSGTLRVKAKNIDGPNHFEGFVDVPLERTTPDGGGGNGGGGNGGGGIDGGNGGGGEPVEIDSTSWTATALTGEAGGVTLQAKLKLTGTPKSLNVEVSGMKEKPKAELLDAAGEVVLTSSVPSVSASAKDYTLKLTCRTTKAEIAAGAEIKTVTVTMADGKVHTITVNKKLKDMKVDTDKPDNDKPDDGNKPGDDKPGDDKPGDDNKPGGSSGGGCDAGVGGLALTLGAAFLLKRKA